MVGEACLPSNAYYPRTPDYTLCSGVHVCWSEHSDSSFVYGFMSLDYGFGTMTTTTYLFVSLFAQVIAFAYRVRVLKKKERKKKTYVGSSGRVSGCQTNGLMFFNVFFFFFFFWGGGGGVFLVFFFVYCKDPAHTVWMHMLIWNFVGHIFSWTP